VNHYLENLGSRRPVGWRAYQPSLCCEARTLIKRRSFARMLLAEPSARPLSLLPPPLRSQSGGPDSVASSLLLGWSIRVMNRSSYEVDVTPDRSSSAV
jgi:hypothetical protein